MSYQLPLPLDSGSDIRANKGCIEGPLPANAPLVNSCGIGTDSVALLIGLRQRDILPDEIMFSHVGNEFDHTYEYISVLEDWLKKVGFPKLRIVQYRPQRFKFHRYETLAGNCLANRTLPSISFGRKSCSLKWKGEELDRETTRLFGDTACYRAVGYDCSPRDIQRFEASSGKKQSRSQDIYIYPLQLWGWTRTYCQEVIAAAGLPDPGKSSCYFCLSAKPNEIDGLSKTQLCTVVIIEANASVNLRTVKGLWRKERMTDYIKAKKLLPEVVITYLWDRWATPERRITDPNALAEDILKEEINALESLWGTTPDCPE